MEQHSIEKAEPKNCISCTYLELMSPENEDSIFNLRGYRCPKKNIVFLNRLELVEAYETCELEKEPSVKLELGSEIIEEIFVINTLFKSLMNAEIKLIREDMRITRDIMMTFKDDKEFPTRIGSLALLFESEKLRELRELLSGQENLKLIKLLESWLNAQGVPYDPDMIQTWESIVKMRNITFPYHMGSIDILSLIRYFGCEFPPDYFHLWESILEKLLESLKKFRGNLVFLKRRTS